MRKCLLIIFMLVLIIPIKVNGYEVSEVNFSGTPVLSTIGTTFEDSVTLDDNSYTLISTCAYASGIYKYLDSDVRDIDYGWSLVFNGEKDLDIFKAIVELSDGSFIVAGYTESSNTYLNARYNNPKKDAIFSEEYTFTNKGGLDAWLIKVDKDGNFVWLKTYGGTGDDYFYDIEVDDKDNLYVVGHTSSKDFESITNKGGKDGLLLKLDKDGNILDRASFGAEYDENFYSLDINENNEVIVGGMLKSESLLDSDDKNSYYLDLYGRSFLVKFNKDFDVEWYQYLPNLEESIKVSNNDENLGNFLLYKSYDIGYHDVIFTSDGSIIAVGSENNEIIPSLSRIALANDYPVGIIAKYDSNGKLEWINKNPANNYDENKGVYYDVKETSKGDFIVAGSFYPPTLSRIMLMEQFDAAVLLYSNTGELLNYKTYTETLEDSNHKNVFKTVELFNDTSVLVAGSKNYFFDESDSNTDSGIMFGVKFDLDFVITELETKNGTFDAKAVNGTGNIVVSPDAGFGLDRIVVKDSNNEDVKVSKNNDGTYKFSLYDDVAVEVTFREYVITELKTENGKFTTDKNEGKGTITITPDEGYEVGKIIVKDTTGKDVTILKNDDGIYSFEMNDDVTVEVIYNKIPTNPKTGVSDYLLSGLVIVILCFGLYYLLSKKMIFKNI